MLIMLDIQSGWPTLARRLLLMRRVIIDHLLGRGHARCLTCKEIFLQHIGQAGHSDAEESDPSGGVDRRQQRSGDRANDFRAIGRTE
jgi:hypothetical protein